MLDKNNPYIYVFHRWFLNYVGTLTTRGKKPKRNNAYMLVTRYSTPIAIFLISRGVKRLWRLRIANKKQLMNTVFGWWKRQQVCTIKVWKNCRRRPHVLLTIIQVHDQHNWAHMHEHLEYGTWLFNERYL